MLGDIADSVTVTSEQGFLSRLMGSFVGALLGIGLFLLSFVVLWWNEGNVIAEKAALDEMRKSVVKVSAEAPSKANNNKLVHATGKLTSTLKLADAPYLAPQPWLKLERKVEMFQWVEESHTRKVGKRTETTYTYKKDWASGREASESFHAKTGHENPPLAVEAKTAEVTKSTFGKFDGKDVLAQLSTAKDVPVAAAMLATKKKAGEELKNGMIYVRAKGATGGDQLGDVRISYSVLEPGTFSIIAKQSGNTFTQHHAKNGKEHFLVTAGAKTPAQMVTAAKEAAGTFAMIVRGIGFLLMWFGLNLLASPVTTLLGEIPFVGSASRMVLGAIFFVVALVLSAATILISMIAHSPILLGVVLVGVVAAAVMAMKKSKQRQAMGMQGGQMQQHHQQQQQRSRAPAKAA